MSFVSQKKDRERSRMIKNDREKEKEREEITINVIKLRHVIQRCMHLTKHIIVLKLHEIYVNI